MWREPASKLVWCVALVTLVAAPAEVASAQSQVGLSVDWLSLGVGGASEASIAKGYAFNFGRLAKTVNLETQIIYFPSLVQPGGNVSGSRAFMFTGGYLIGPEIRQKVRVYGAIGFGELYQNFSLIPSPNVEDTSIFSNSITVDLGIGAIGLFARRIGVRGEFRRGRAFNLNPPSADEESNPDGSLNLAAFNFTHIDYWRVKIGIVFAFGVATATPSPIRR